MIYEISYEQTEMTTLYIDITVTIKYSLLS